ncbi:Uridylate kinase [Labeo rohita]|uniref:Uridylate kinase n=1 Tax=Labeo rohita TaxID=84645 RepID=A0ABQ8LVK5_LABRO|nr:Uridylate kinase [Labeo rohita]
MPCIADATFPFYIGFFLSACHSPLTLSQTQLEQLEVRHRDVVLAHMKELREPLIWAWCGHHLTWHINCLEMLAVFLALKQFLPDLRDRHVSVRTDNTAVVSYINHPFTGWRTRSLCSPRGHSSHGEQFTSLGISMWEQTSCRDRGQGLGNGCFTPRW